MFCPKCGKINPENNEICSGCNAPLHDEDEKKAPAKKSNTGKFLLAAAIIIIVVAVVVLVLSGCGKIEAPGETLTF